MNDCRPNIPSAAAQIAGAAMGRALQTGARMLLLVVWIGFGFAAPPAAAQDAFITTWETTSPAKSITLPTSGGPAVTDYDSTVDWGDGTVETITGDDPDPPHTYAAADTYTVSVTDTFPHFFLDADFFGDGDAVNAAKLRSVEQWGAIQWESMDSAFEGAEAMVLNATDVPTLTSVTSMREMFRGADTFNGAIGNWTVAGVTDMAYLFADARSFNQDVSGWDVSKGLGG